MPTRLAVLAALLLAGCSGTSQDTPQSVAAPTSPAGDSAAVVRVLDGDSLVVATGGVEAEVRLIGINAPEGDECHGDAARAALAELVGETITLVIDDEDSDRFGRLLRFAYVDGANVNLTMVNTGDAIPIQGGHSLEDEFLAAGDAAAAAGLGMWSPTACGSDGVAGSIAIADYEYNPPGPDEDNLNGEWIAISNEGPTAVAMGRWILRDESTQHRYRFPASFTLDPGAEVQVFSGCGADTSQAVFWCADGPVWSNGGDTVILQDSTGTVVVHDRFLGQF